MEFEPLAPAAEVRPEAGLDLLRDVNVSVRVELGRARMYVQDILKLGPGSVVSLESLTGDPLDVYVNDRLVARGEVLVINENFAIRITEVIAPQKP
jgi:flagellar motor switch protein FliN/FliY